MYTLFNDEPLTRGAQFQYPQFDYARDVLLRSTNQYVAYRRANPAFVGSDHILIKTLQSINIEYNGDLDRYRNLVEQRVAMFTGSLGYSSSLFKGKPFMDDRAPFYGGEAIEILIATDEDFSLRNAGEQWKDWSPIRVLAHHRSDLGIESLDGNSRSSEQGLAVIAINLPMLACQYQLFRAEQRELNVDYKQTIAQFVMTYPLTNAIFSHLDIAIFNRLSRRLMGAATGETSRRLPFYVPDLTGRVDSALDTVVDRVMTSRLAFADILRNCPAIAADDQLMSHRLPKMPFTSQVIWAMVAARLDLTAFLLHLREENDNARGVAEVARIRRALIEARSGKLLENGLPNRLVEYFKRYIDENISPYIPA